MLTILKPKFLIAEQKSRFIIQKDWAIVIAKDTIIDLGPTDIISAKYPGSQSLELPNHLLTPGLINAHAHAAMNLLRGLGEDTNLQDWLQNFIWPAEKALLSEEFVYDGTTLACAEMLKNGITTFNDHYFYPEACIKAANSSHMRAVVGALIIDSQTVGNQTTTTLSNTIEKLLNLQNNITTIAYAPHSPYTVTDEQFQEIAQLQEKHQLPLHIHLQETQHEIDESMKKHNLRPIERIHKLGLLNDKTMCIHMAATNLSDLDLCASQQAHIISCPHANLKLASGICPTHEIRARNINLGIGTDGACSNNRLDILSDGRTLTYLTKCLSQDPEALTALQAFEIMTINNAKALGLDDKIGSITIGKQADLAAFNLNNLSTWPGHAPAADLLYAGSSSQCEYVWVAGRQVVAAGNLTTIPTKNLNDIQKKWKKETSKIFTKKRGA